MAVAVQGCGEDDDGATDGSGAGSGGSAEGTAGGGDGANDPKQDTCQCYIDLGIVPDDAALKAECMANVSDACVTCTQGITSGASCSTLTEADFNDCAANCDGMISPPATPESCKTIISAFGESPVDVSVTDCFCDNCLDVFAPCMVNRGCMSIILCIGERGCDTLDCLNDEVCGPLITNVLTVYPDALTTLMLPVSGCNNTYQCRPNPPIDGGAGDAGGTDGGVSDAGAN